MGPSTVNNTRRTAILYQNADRDITLLDIPTSVAIAQGRSDTLLSVSALEAPFEVREEPKSDKARAKVSRDLPKDNLHQEYRNLIETALAEIRLRVSGSWCMPRQLLTQALKHGDMQMDDPEKELESRLREWAAADQSKGDDTAFDFQKMMASLSATPEQDVTVTEAVVHKWLMSYRPTGETRVDVQHAGSVFWKETDAQREPWTSSFHNPEDNALDLVVFENATQPGQEVPAYRFTVPPRATVFLGDAAHPDAFRASFRELTDEYMLPRHFDLVLLDPPWPNRSAKRKGAYEQVGGMPHVKKMLLGMDIEAYLEHNALVGIWITNKEALREHVLGTGGLFERWNIGLIEEWIWVKTTTHGEPMFDLDGVWRKPYEILLLGRAAPNAWTIMAHAPVVKKRVIAAVPDLHSRKPCLKELLDSHMPDPLDYAALEIFPRYLVAGWTSWGNEALKYNWARYWAPNPEQFAQDSPSR